MPTKIIKLRDAVRFAKENGYLFAVYKKKEDNYNLVNECFCPDNEKDLIDAKIIVKTTEAATDFNEFLTTDKKYCFRLHNTFNVPKIIPIFYRCSFCYRTISTEQYNKNRYCLRCESLNE